MMAEKFGKYAMTDLTFREITGNLETDYECEEYIDDKVCVGETNINVDDTELNDYVRVTEAEQCGTAAITHDIKIKLSSEVQNNKIDDHIKIQYEISTVDVKIECDNGLLFCECCCAYYKDYCMECGMLVHVLNGNALSNATNRTSGDIPSDFLEIADLFGEFRICALRVIPKGVKFGPFTGLSASGCTWKLKGGKFVVNEENKELLNWMQYIIPAKNILERNLLPFQCDGNIYYRSVCEIQAGEDLLVHFGGEYADGLDKDVEMDFIPPVEENVQDVFACTFCCLGFSSRIYLAQHRKICPNKISETVSTEELEQCPSCKIYLEKEEYFEYHAVYCCEKIDRKCVSLMPNKQAVKVNRTKTRRRMYECSRCMKYRTPYKADLESHNNEQHEVKTKTKYYAKKRAQEKQEEFKYNCEVCVHEAKLRAALEKHTKTKHLEGFNYKCEFCKFTTNRKLNLGRHMKRKHPKNFHYECEIRDCKTKVTSYLKIHVKTKHLKQFNYKCEMCDYKTNMKKHLERHVKTKHLKEFEYECETCDFRTNQKLHLEIHVKTKHLKEFEHKCETCDFRTNQKSHLEIHVKTKHLKEFNYKCDACGYKTNKKFDLRKHIKTKHLKEFSHKCEMCDFKTNQKSNLESHTKVVHLNEFIYKCELCEYKAKQKTNLQVHVKSKHLNEFSYQCEMCSFKTNLKLNMKRHMKSKHVKTFDYACGTCDYKTNWKTGLESHMKTKHLQEFDYCCEMCEYKTNHKSNLEIHRKAVHLKEFNYKCSMCDYRTKWSSDLGRHKKAKHNLK